MFAPAVNGLSALVALSCVCVGVLFLFACVSCCVPSFVVGCCCLHGLALAAATCFACVFECRWLRSFVFWLGLVTCALAYCLRYRCPLVDGFLVGLFCLCMCPLAFTHLLVRAACLCYLLWCVFLVMLVLVCLGLCLFALCLLSLVVVCCSFRLPARGCC